MPACASPAKPRRRRWNGSAAECPLTGSSRRAGCCAGASIVIWSGCWDPRAWSTGHWCTSPTRGSSCSPGSAMRCWGWARSTVSISRASMSSVRATALQLHRHGEDVFGSPRWQRFLVAAGNVLRTNSRWIPATAVADFELSVAELAAAPAPTEVREELRRLRASAGRARAVRRSLEADARRPPLLEPLLPALTRAILWWGADHPTLVVLHDEQSALTRWRLAEIATELDRQHPGHTFHLDRVDSRKDPRVQIADLVAGIARRAARGSLTGQAEDELLDSRPSAHRSPVDLGRRWVAREPAVGAVLLTWHLLLRHGCRDRAVLMRSVVRSSLRRAGQVPRSPGVASWCRRPIVRSACLRRAS